MPFLSTLSLRRATSQQPEGTTRTTYFYPRSPCGERLYTDLNSAYGALISIHALLAESDISALWMARSHLLFLSTLSLRRATALRQLQFALCRNFYPRSPCGERLISDAPSSAPYAISIHALLAESDGSHYRSSGALKRFLSTLSLRRATWANFGGFFWWVISIHALLAESDRRSVKLFRQNYISIHALLAESDFEKFEGVIATKISIHALLAESDYIIKVTDNRPAAISIHALLAESD